MAFVRPAAISLLARNACVQCRNLPSRRITSNYHTIRTAAAPRSQPQLHRVRNIAYKRGYSTSDSSSQLYDFKQIQSLSSSPTPSRILIDVREPSELDAGYIATAINIPIKSQPDALFLPAEEFEDRFGFPKPDTNAEVVFYCRAGVRASSAAELARQNGYTKIGEYRGSMLDWEKQGGELVKP